MQCILEPFNLPRKRPKDRSLAAGAHPRRGSRSALAHPELSPYIESQGDGIPPYNRRKRLMMPTKSSSHNEGLVVRTLELTSSPMRALRASRTQTRRLGISHLTPIAVKRCRRYSALVRQGKAGEL